MPEDYTRRFDYGGQVARSRLIRDEIEVLAVPHRSGNRRWWKYAHRMCKVKGLYRNLTAAPLLFSTFICKTGAYIFHSDSSLKALLSLIQTLRDSLCQIQMVENSFFGFPLFHHQSPFFWCSVIFKGLGFFNTFEV